MGKLIYLWISATTVFLVLTNLTEGGEMRSTNRCASTCKCDGPKIDCSDSYLYQIPDLTIIQTYVLSLNFSNNEIETVTTSNFIYFRLGRLQELQLDGNNIYDIEDTAFDSLPNLTYLDISNNMLESVSDHMVEKNPKLLHLSLAKNMFNGKTPKLISKSLEYLDLSYCKISHFNESHIEHLPSLKVLQLSSNTLTYIHHHTFDRLPLTSLSLSYNYWKCSCDSLRLFYRLVHQNITIENNIECLHDNNLFEGLANLGGPIYNKTFCANELKEIEHKAVEKQEEGGFNQNLTKGENMHSNRCASACNCKGSKIDCSDGYLHQIPDLTVIQIYIHSINFSNNEIENLTKSDFMYVGLGKLQELQLDNNGIYNIEETTFDSLPNLTYLDISNNMLKNVSDHMVKKNTKLLQLNLAKNMFSAETPKLISNSMEYLDLSNCKISHLDERHVEHLPNLKVLHLRANTLVHIHHHTFDRLPLTSLSLSYNYWKCSCDSLRLFHHLVHQNITIGSSIQCLHENNVFEDLTNLGGPIYNKTFCASESKEIKHNRENDTRKILHKSHHMQQKHKEVEKQEESGFNQNCTIFTITIVGVVLVSLIASVVAWKITTNKKIRPISHIYEEPSQTLLI